MKSSLISRLGSACLFIAVLASQPTLAQSPAQQLDRLETRQQELTEQQRALRQKVQSISRAMADIEPVEGPEKQAYDEAAAAFEEASESFEKDPSPTNRSRVRNAEFRLHLAERKYRSASGELQNLEAEQDAAESELIQVRRELDRVQEELPELRQRVARQRERAQAAAAARAREREQQVAQSRASKPQTAKAEPTPRPEPRPTDARVEKLREQLADKDARGRNNERQVQSSQSGPPQNEPMDLDRNFTLLTNRADVLTALANLQLRVGGDSLKIRSNKILNIRHFVDGKEADKSSHRFKGLGNYQYRAEAAMKPGENRVRVSFSRWNINLPKAFGNREMVILMDATDRNAPKIICFPAELEEA